MKNNHHGLDDADSIPPLSDTPETESAHIGRTARMPGKGHRTEEPTNSIIWAALLVASIATFAILVLVK